MLRSSLWFKHLIKLPGNGAQRNNLLWLEPTLPRWLPTFFFFFFFHLQQTLNCESKFTVDWSFLSLKMQSLTYHLEFGVRDKSLKQREGKHAARARGAGAHFRLDSSFSSPASHIYFVPLCLKSNWSSKTGGRDWIADWIASQGHLSIEEIHNCNRTAAYGQCKF